MNALYLSVAQVEEFYGIGPRLLRAIRERRLVRFVRAGHRTVLVHRESLEKYLRARTSPAIGEARQ
ncbi:MAG TPA: hypothetical protein PKE12_05775 [Kiritimatiellia bacterium]|nr:hypothetical protein [Kiritimatiellia bacterium]